MVGSSNGYTHPYEGMLICQLCRRKINLREHAVLKQGNREGKLDAEQKKRLEDLDNDVVKHRGRDKESREKRKAENGGILSDAKKACNVLNERNRKGRDFETLLEDPKKYNEKLEKQRDYDAAQKDMGKKKKAGANRGLTNKQLYPQEVQSLFARAAKEYGRLRGEKSVCYNKIQELFDLLLLRENKQGGLLAGTVPIYHDGKPKYRRHAYKTALATVMTKETARLWSVNDYNEEEAPAARKRAAEMDANEGGVIQHIADTFH